MFDMLIYISFYLGSCRGREGGGMLNRKKVFPLLKSRLVGEVEATSFPCFFWPVKGILRGQKVYLAKD